MVEDLARHYQLLHDKRNSFLYWYPKIKDIALTPRSVWLEIDFDLSWIDYGVPAGVILALKKLAKQLEPIEPYPLFIRTDVNSGKHDYKNTCFIESEDKLGPNVNNLIVDTVMKDLFPRAIILREFVELDWEFKAFWGELPIAPEVRVMVKDGEVERWFFYWPEDAIRKPSKENWRELLAEMRKIAEKEQDQFLGIAERVAKKFDGYWSVDFARTKRGVWILIDMALGEVSWRPEVKI